MEYNLYYSIICFVSTIFVFSIGLLSLIHYNGTPSAKPLGILMFCAGIYLFGYAFEIMRGDTTWIFIWLRVEYLGLAFLPGCWLWLSLVFTRKYQYLNVKFFLFIFGFSLFVLLSVFTNNLHHLYFTSIKINTDKLISVADLGKGILYNIQALWMFLTFLLSATIYISYFFNIPKMMKKQTIIMIIGSLGIIIAYLIYLLGFSPFNFDTGPFVIVLNGCIFAYGIFKTGLLEISPIARDNVFDSMKDGVIVTDSTNNIIDFNNASLTFIPGLSTLTIGKNLFTVFPELEHYFENNSNKEPLVILHHNDIHYYDIKRVPVSTKTGNQIGVAWYIGQVTEQHHLLAKLKYYAEKDELTGIWNRRKWFELAEHALMNSTNNFYAIMFIDIDHFKLINDTFGHEAGDKTLIHIIDVITKQLTDKEVFGRLGGEEFGVVIPNSTIELVETLSQQLAKTIADSKFIYETNEIRVTISAGIGYSTNCSTKPFEEYMRSSDLALYEAKNSGRNKICMIEL